MGIDPVFYEIVGSARADDLAAAARVALPRRGRTVCVFDLADRSRAGPGDLTYCASADPDHLKSLRASIAFVPAGSEHVTGRGVTGLGARHPAHALSMAAHLLARPRRLERGSAAIHPSADIESGVHIGPNVVIGQNSAIGAGTVIDPGAVIGPGVSIGRASHIGANSVISFAIIGDDVSIHAGAIIGTGAPAGTRRDFPADSYWGRVIVQDSVSIGATSIVRRGFIGDTVIGLTTHIGNGCVIAEDCLIDTGAAIDDRIMIASNVIVGRGASIGTSIASNAKAGHHQTIAPDNR